MKANGHLFASQNNSENSDFFDNLTYSFQQRFQQRL
jgi:hypothetical protein